VTILCRIDSVDQLRFAGLPRCGGCVLGVALRGWACARRDRSGGKGFRADARWGLGCCDPMLATAQPRCRRCVVGVWVGFLLGTGDWDCWVGSWGGFAGLGLRSQGSFGR